MPTLIVLAGVVVKYAMAQMAGMRLDAGSRGYRLKALPWGLFVGAVGFATNSLTSHLNLITKIYFPREVFPFACLLTQLVDTGLSSLVAAGLLILLHAVARIGDAPVDRAAGAAHRLAHRRRVLLLEAPRTCSIATSNIWCRCS